jgi:hypothetical protein
MAGVAATLFIAAHNVRHCRSGTPQQLLNGHKPKEPTQTDCKRLTQILVALLVQTTCGSSGVLRLLRF